MLRPVSVSGRMKTIQAKERSLQVLVSGIFSIVAGIVVLIFPKILNYLIAFWLIVIGIIAIVVSA